MRLQNIKKRKFVDKDIKFISEKKANELNYHSFKSGDIILAKLGEQLGTSCIVPEKYKYGIVVGDVIRIRIPEGTCNKQYILSLLNSKYCENLLNSKVIGATRPRVNLNDIRNTPVPFPPIELQNKFAKIVKEVEQLKEHQKHSKKQIEDLFNALMQKAFKGELVV
jgi:type I restriction enzyme S subunit